MSTKCVKCLKYNYHITHFYGCNHFKSTPSSYNFPSLHLYILLFVHVFVHGMMGWRWLTLQSLTAVVIIQHECHLWRANQQWTWSSEPYTAYYWPQLSSHQSGHNNLLLHHITESTCWSYYSKAVGFESLLKIGFQLNVKILYYHLLQYVVDAVLKIIFSTGHNNVDSIFHLKYMEDTFIEDDFNIVRLPHRLPL